MGCYLGQSVYNDSEVTRQFVEDEIAKNGKGVFFATYGQTTFQNILQEYNNGKIIVVKYQPVTPGETTTYYFNLVQFNTETFDFVGVMGDGTIYRTSINANEGWTNVTTHELDEIEFVEYNVDSYTTIKSHYDNGKFIVLKYRQQTPLVTKYYFYPLISVDETNKEIVFGSLELGQNNKKITFTVTDSTGWAAPSESPAVVVDAALDSSSHNPVENMAIAAELTAINNKITGDLNDIFLALASKGVTVPAGAGLDDVAGLIDDIPAGGGVEPIPENWVRVSGIKSKYRNVAFRLDISSMGLTNEDLISIMLVNIDTINAQAYPATPYAVPNMSLFGNCNQEFYILDGQINLVTRFRNRIGSTYTNNEVMQSSSYGGFKNVTMSRNWATISGVNYGFDSRSYQIMNVNYLNLWGPFENDIFTPMTIFEATLKKDDKILAHIIPVANTNNNNYPGFYDEISGTLLEAMFTSLEVNQFEVIP